MNYNNQYQHITVILSYLILSLIHVIVDILLNKAFNGLQILQR